MKILICYWGMPLPVKDGQDLRIREIFSRLSQNHELQLFSLIDFRFHLGRNVINTNNEMFKQIITRRLKRKTIGHIISALLPSKALDVEFPYIKRKILNDLSELILREKIDLIYVNGYPTSMFLAELNIVGKVLDLCDARSLIWNRAYRNCSKPILKCAYFLRYLRARKIEQYLGSRYDIVTFVSKEDASYFKKIYNDTEVQVIHNGVDIDYFRPIENKPVEPGSILFFGNMDYHPNIDAVLYFAKKIFPLIKLSKPDAKFYVVGRNPVSEIRALGRDDIIITGEVEDIRPYIANVSLVIVPMRIGSGVKNKILESLAMAKPIVTTSIALSGLSDDVVNILVVSDSEIDFARSVINLLDDPAKARDRGIVGREIVVKKHGWDYTAISYENIFLALKDRVTSQGS